MSRVVRPGRLNVVAAVLLAVAFGVQAVRATAIAVVPSGDAYATSLGRHIRRWLQSEGVACDLVTGAQLAKGTEGKRLVFWVTPKGTAAELAVMQRLRARGAKSAVFYSPAPSVAAVMGVRLGSYKKPPAGTYAKMYLGKAGPPGAPSEMAQSSVNIYTAFPVPGRSRTIATWRDRAGRETGDAAVLASDAGWWMTHVFLADGDEEAKSRFLASLASACVPGSWSYARWLERKRAAFQQDMAYAQAQAPRAGEIRAVWEHSGEGLYPGDWAKTIALLRRNGITDLYVNVAGAAFAHYASGVLPRSAVCDTRGDQLAACLAAARGSGVRVHAWLLCFNATRGTPARLADFAKKGWRVKDQAGRLTEYLDPANPALRAYLLAAMREIVTRYPVAGVHLDFVRYYERAARPGSTRAVFDARARTVSTFVAAARREVKAARRGCVLSAAVLGKYPSCVDAVGQDWENWIDAGLIDFIVPMNYTEDPKRYAEYVTQQGRTRAHAMRIVSGIGVTANESRLGPRRVIEQIVAARRAGLAGVAFFDLDYTLANTIFPYLRQGVFRPQ